MSSLSPVEGFNIKSLYEQVKKANDVSDTAARDGNLYDLFRATITNSIELITYAQYIVPITEEMRIDLILKSIYELDFISLEDYYADVDVILTINNIDNPLNIRSGQVIKYPTLIELSSHRITEENDLSKELNSALNSISVPSKKTRVDNSRSNYNKTGRALPPIAKSNPKNSVSINQDKFKIGGI
jgi:hypothetical protein